MKQQVYAAIAAVFIGLGLGVATSNYGRYPTYRLPEVTYGSVALAYAHENPGYTIYIDGNEYDTLPDGVIENISMFPGGEICLCFPYGHVVYVYNKVVYDVEGISTAEYDMLIPIDFIGDAIKDFKHVRSEVFDSTPDDLVRIKEEWLKTGREVDAPALPGAWFVCRAFGVNAPISANYMYYKNLEVDGDFKVLLEAAL